MKIAIASEKKELNSQISEKGGRAPYYLIFEDKKLIETIKNHFAVGGGGAGWSVAYMLAEKEIDLVIIGKAGEKMKEALKDKNIDYKEIQNETVDEIISKL